jgi:hypothetical protein
MGNAWIELGFLLEEMSGKARLEAERIEAFRY